MKKTFTIFILFIATLTVVLHNIIPHHHHGDRLCTTMDICQEDCSGLDHQAHHSDNEEKECTKGCTMNSEYIIKNNNNQEDNIIPDIIMPACNILVNYLLVNEYSEPKKIIFAEIPLLYESSYYNNGNSLRAPPVA